MSQVCSIGDCWGFFANVDTETSVPVVTKGTWDDQRKLETVIQDGEENEILTGYVVHTPSNDQYGHRKTADTDLTIRIKMLFLFFGTPLIGTLVAMPLRVAHLCSAQWAIGQAYPEALSEWKTERFQCFDAEQLEMAPDRFDLYTKVALKSLKYFVEAAFKLATYPLAMALCMGASLMALVPTSESHFWARRIYAQIQEAWSIDARPQSRTSLTVNHLMNFQAPCMQPKRVWEEYNLYEKGYDLKEPVDQIYNLKQQVISDKPYFPDKTADNWIQILDELREAKSIKVDELIATQQEIAQFVSKMDKMVDETLNQETISEIVEPQIELQKLQEHFDHFNELIHLERTESAKIADRKMIEEALGPIENMLKDLEHHLEGAQGKDSPGEQIAHLLGDLHNQHAPYEADPSFKRVFQRLDAASQRLAILRSNYQIFLESQEEAERKYQASLKEKEEVDDLDPASSRIDHQPQDGNCWLHVILNGLKREGRDPGVSHAILRNWVVDWMAYNYEKDETLRHYLNGDAANTGAIPTHIDVETGRLRQEEKELRLMHKRHFISTKDANARIISARNEIKKLKKFTFRDYLEHMRRNGSYGSRAELYALHKIFAINIEIWRNRPQGLTNEFDLPMQNPSYKRTIGAVMNEAGNHYDLLKAPESSSSGEASGSSEQQD